MTFFLWYIIDSFIYVHKKIKKIVSLNLMKFEKHYRMATFKTNAFLGFSWLQKHNTVANEKKVYIVTLKENMSLVVLQIIVTFLPKFMKDVILSPI